MGNDILNLRFGSWHLQILKDRPFISFGRNRYHDTARHEPGWRWFEAYTLPWRSFDGEG